MWKEVLYWIDHIWSSKECVCCACGPSERPDVCTPYVVSLCDFAYYVFG